MCLVVLVPLVARMYSVEVTGLSRSIFVFPAVGCGVGQIFLQIEHFFLLIHIFLCFGSVKCFRGEVGTAWRFLVYFHLLDYLDGFHYKTRGCYSTAAFNLNQTLIRCNIAIVQ